MMDLQIKAMARAATGVVTVYDDGALYDANYRDARGLRPGDAGFVPPLRGVQTIPWLRGCGRVPQGAHGVYHGAE